MPATRPVPVQPDTAQAISNTLIRVMKIMSAMKHRAPRDHPALDPSHYPVLFCVSAEPRRVSAVADSIHSDVSTVSRQVTHLVQHGLLEKIGDPDDRRAQLLSLSPAGRVVIEALVERRGRWFEQLLSSWSDDDARCFEQLLTRFGDDAETFKAQLEAMTVSPDQTHTSGGPTASRPDEDEHFLHTLRPANRQTNQELPRER